MTGKQLISIGIGLLLIYGVFTVGAPFLLAAIVAISLEPIILFFMKKLHMRRMMASTITCSMFILFLLLLMYLLGLKVYTQLVEYWQNVPHYFFSANLFIQSTLVHTQGVFDRLQPDLAEQIQRILFNLTTNVQTFVNSLSSSILSFATTIPEKFVFFIVFCVAVFLFSFSLDTMRERILDFFEEQSQSQVNEVLQGLKRSIFGFLGAQIILSAFTYVVTLAGLFILGAPYPLAIALLVMIVDILPILGVGSALIPWAVYQAVAGNLYMAIGLVILFLVITVLRRVIEPKIVGDAVGIGALPALISMYVGFKLVGLIGFFIGPLIIIIYSAMRKAGLFQIKIKF